MKNLTVVVSIVILCDNKQRVVIEIEHKIKV